MKSEYREVIESAIGAPAPATEAPAPVAPEPVGASSGKR
jgi:hypothetical protein